MQFDLTGIRQTFERLNDAIAENIDNGDAYEGFRDATGVYMDAQRQTFMSEGAGDWPGLAASTEKDRLRQGYGPDHPMLQRSETLLHAFDRGAPGNVFRVEKDGIEVGFGGPARHPGYANKRGGDLTIGALAAYQHHGTSRIPSRPLLRRPTGMLLAEMTRPIAEGWRRMIKTAINS